MSLSILGSIGSKFGLDLVSNIMDKTLPKAKDFMRGALGSPLDLFESVVKSFGGKASKTAPAKQFSLAFPKRLGQATGQSATDSMKSMAGKIGNLLSALSVVKDIADVISGFNPKQIQQQSSADTGFGSGLNVDTMAMAQSTGYGSQEPGQQTGMSPMDMFQKMQEAQQAAQMFEMAVKISEMQHQAAMSAIRGIKY